MSLNAHQQAVKDQFIAEGGIWSNVWDSIVRVDADYFEGYIKLRRQPNTASVLGRKNQQLILTALESSASTLFEYGMKVHINAAIDAGASIQDVFEVLALTSTLGIDTMTSAVPVLQKVLSEEGLAPAQWALDDRRAKLKDSFIEKLGHWSNHWLPLLEMCPEFFEGYMHFAAAPYNRQNGLELKLKELIYIAIEASATHRYEERLEIHLRNALRAGATTEEILEVLQLAVMVGVHTPVVGCKYLQERVSRD